MTLEECKNLNLGKGFRTPEMPSCTMAGFVPPEDPNIGDRALTPDSKPTYNGMSLNDVKTLQKFRYSDDLHRPDLINQTYSRATSLKEFGKMVGAKDFINSYLHKK